MLSKLYSNKAALKGGKKDLFGKKKIIVIACDNDGPASGSQVQKDICIYI